MDKMFLMFATFYGTTAVGLGAFASHGLRGQLSDKLLNTFQTGVEYQMYHALALLAVGIVSRLSPSFAVNVAGWLFIAGVLLFSCSLYGLALGGPRLLGPITPIGGMCFIGGWIALAVACWRLPAL
ncbi:MAG TPA: DUF423 domain-containing protein [Pseudomonadales bacterium]|nr:DUF423 domain-containing protein [Pseudomonadales bacterium]